MASEFVSDTLRVLHLPPGLSDQKRDELFKKYGATHTKTIRKSSTYTTTFVKFPDKNSATQACLRLHQLEVKGRYLSVEFAKKSFECESIDNLPKPLATATEKKDSTTEHYQAFLKKLNSWTAGYDFSQPPPPNITYKYPSPTKNTLLRIAIQLVREPAFYTQVLHLMNKMNLAPPFEELDEEFPTLKEVYDVEKYSHIFGTIENKHLEGGLTEEQVGDEMEEESELESDEEAHSKPSESLPIKRKLPQSKTRLKIPKFVNPGKNPLPGPSSQRVIKPEEMFESVRRAEAKNLKIELKTVGKIGDFEPEVMIETVEGGFGLMSPAAKDLEDQDEGLMQASSEHITSEELAANRISSNDQRLLPVFKNYHPGKASCRLYIKNLSKHVEMKDLEYIYRRYIIASLNNSQSQFDVRLMQEGRMKGQAFVTLQNMGQAQLALNETNGFILKDKPMVVQFAKVSKS